VNHHLGPVLFDKGPPRRKGEKGGGEGRESTLICIIPVLNLVVKDDFCGFGHGCLHWGEKKGGEKGGGKKRGEREGGRWGACRMEQ